MVTVVVMAAVGRGGVVAAATEVGGVVAVVGEAVTVGAVVVVGEVSLPDDPHVVVPSATRATHIADVKRRALWWATCDSGCESSAGLTQVQGEEATCMITVSFPIFVVIMVVLIAGLIVRKIAELRSDRLQREELRRVKQAIEKGPAGGRQGESQGGY